MDNQITIPAQIKRWNWGAFLLTPFWCMRHGIWSGLLLFIPILGFFIPVILGVKGSQKAWIKNSHEPVDAFLKRQRFWGFSGLFIWIALIALVFTPNFYSHNFSDGVKMGIQVANTNQRLVTLLGNSIKKSSFLNNEYDFVVTPKSTTLFVSFDATGTQNTGHIDFQWEKRDGNWVATGITVVDNNGKSSQLVRSPMLISAFSKDAPFEKSRLENALNNMIEKKDGYAILVRSEENNDFIQTATQLSDDGAVAFSLQYSNGYTPSNKQLYESKNLIHTKDEIVKIFTEYAMGSDAHITSIEWNPLALIEPETEDAGYFMFGEDCQAKD